MGKKLPALHFYTGDWWKDDGAMALNCEERGAWTQILYIMHDCKRRGYLEINGAPYPISALSRKIGLETTLECENIKSILHRLMELGVVSVEKKTGILYSRRMVLDEKTRQVHENSGKNGGRPHKPKANQTNNQTVTKTEPNPNQTPEDESEYEVRLIGLKDNERIEQDLAFELSWRYYPERLGKKAAKRSFRATVITKGDWLRHVAAFNAYVAHVKAKRRKGQKLDWQNGSTWFNNWEDWAKKAEAVE